jgi:endo-1,4-beta-xylanase
LERKQPIRSWYTDSRKSGKLADGTTKDRVMIRLALAISCILVYLGGCGEEGNNPQDTVGSTGGRGTSGSGGFNTSGSGAGGTSGGSGAAGINGTGGAGAGAGAGAGSGGAGTSGGGAGGTSGTDVFDGGGFDEGGGAIGGASGSGGAGTGSAGTGSAGTGGAGGTGGTPNACTEPEKTVCNNEIGSHCGYTYEYWKDQGTGCLTLKSDGFSVEWSNINNLLGRRGLRPGSTNQIVTYDANYQPSGNSYLCVYGWTQNPLVEYYIVDSWGTWRPPGGEGHMGTVNSDGGAYDIYRTQRVNQPSIEGTATFYQYWSVRTEKRTSGTITVANHFDAWQSHGMNMGSLYEVSMCVEGYQSSGTADVSVSMR